MVPENTHTPPPLPKEGFFGLIPSPLWKFQLGSYIPLQILAFKTPSPLEFPMTLCGGVWIFSGATQYGGGGGAQGWLNLPLPVPFNPGSHPIFVGSRLFAFFRLQNIAQCCIIFPFFSHFPPPWESRFPPPFLPVSRRPVRPPTVQKILISNPFHRRLGWICSSE